MDRALYIAAGGASQALQSHLRETHNLANTNTTGFRADLARAETIDLHGPGYPDRAYVSQHAEAVPDLAPGPIQTTGRDLDVAVEGEGFIVVQAPDGSEAFTRDGNFRVDANGLLTNGGGHPVLGEAGPIALPPFEQIEIGRDGTISIRTPGQPPGAATVVDRILLAAPEPSRLVKMDGGLIRDADGEPAVGNADVVLTPGAIEGSNVSPITSMVEMIEIQRQFETHVQMMRTVEENDRSAAQLLRLRR